MLFFIVHFSSIYPVASCSVWAFLCNTWLCGSHVMCVVRFASYKAHVFPDFEWIYSDFMFASRPSLSFSLRVCVCALISYTHTHRSVVVVFVALNFPKSLTLVSVMHTGHNSCLFLATIHYHLLPCFLSRAICRRIHTMCTLFNFPRAPCHSLTHSLLPTCSLTRSQIHTHTMTLSLSLEPMPSTHKNKTYTRCIHTVRASDPFIDFCLF